MSLVIGDECHWPIVTDVRRQTVPGRMAARIKKRNTHYVMWFVVRIAWQSDRSNSILKGRYLGETVEFLKVCSSHTLRKWWP